MKSKLVDIIGLDSELIRLLDEKRKLDEHISRCSQLLILSFLDLKDTEYDIEKNIPRCTLNRIRSGLIKLLKNPKITDEIQRRLR